VVVVVVLVVVDVEVVVGGLVEVVVAPGIVVVVVEVDVVVVVEVVVDVVVVGKPVIRSAGGFTATARITSARLKRRLGVFVSVVVKSLRAAADQSEGEYQTEAGRTTALRT
jgi:hypothetical protein